MSLLPSANDCCNDCSSGVTITLEELLALYSGGGLTGQGSPEEVISAAVGVFYTDITDPDHPVVYQKTTGTGNTGWKLIAAT